MPRWACVPRILHPLEDTAWPFAPSGSESAIHSVITDSLRPQKYINKLISK